MKFNEIDWVSACASFGIDKNLLKLREGPCPICGGTKRFRFTNRTRCGDWFCNQCRGGNGFTLIKQVTNQTDADIYKQLKKLFGLSEGLGALREYQKVDVELTPEESARNCAKLRKVIRGTKRLSLMQDDPVSLYMGHRVLGCDLTKLSKYVRYHPSLEYWEVGDDDKYRMTGLHPAMVLKVVDGKGDPVTLHRTYLTKDGRKALVEEPKMQMSGKRKLRGAAVRLFEHPTSRVLGICEGAENGWGIATAYRYEMSVWSMLNAGNLSIADIPREKFDTVIIFGDNDPYVPRLGYRPGEHAARMAYQKLKKDGFEVFTKIPEKERMDFDDVWNNYYRMKQLQAA